MPKETLIAIGAGVLSAISATAFLIQAPAALIFVYLASLPLFMAGLALGPRAVTVAGAIGFMIVGLLGGAISAGVFGIMQAIPALLVVRQMLLQRAPLGTPEGSPDSDSRVEWYSPGDMLCWLTALAAATRSAPPRRISPRISSDSLSSGKPTMFIAVRGSPPMA